MIKVCKQSKHHKVLRMFAGLSCLVCIVEGQIDISSTPASAKSKLPLHFPSLIPSKTELKPDLDINEPLKSSSDVSRSEEKQCKIVREKFDFGYQQQRPSACLNPPLSVITQCGSGVDMVVAASSRGIISWAQYGEWDNNYQTSTVLGRSTHAQQLPAITLRTCIYGIVADYPKTKVIVNCLHISPNIKITIGNPTSPIHVQENYDFISKGNFLMIRADISNLYFPSLHFNGAFTCIWNSVNH